MNEISLAAAIAFAVALAAIALLRATPAARRLHDTPNARSLHASPTPRIGGLGIVAGVMAASAWSAPDGMVAALLLAALALSLVSLADDVRHLPALTRLSAHFAAAAVAVWLVGSALPWGVMVVSIVAVAWMTNLFNFMDGADGLAGGMGVIGFGTMAAAAAAAGETGNAIACAAVSGACAGFLPHNFPPARVFMGDAGSIPLGFLAAALGLHGWTAGAWPWWFAPLVFSPFIVDATVTLARRARARERLWEAHRQHAYQRLVLSGWSKRRLALHGYALMLAAAASALAFRRSEAPYQWVTIGTWVAIYVLLHVAVERRSPRTRPDGEAGAAAGPE
jgi:UDP-GlcNAc:undecaprenyl-phosphate GlcNAc-1-phosphate transferase